MPIARISSPPKRRSPSCAAASPGSIDGYTEGLIEKAEFEQRITGLRQRIKTWEQQAATLQDEAALRRTLSLIIGRLEDVAKQVRQRMDSPDWSLQRDLIRLLVKRVEVDHDEINVVFRVAPPPASLSPGSEGGRSGQDCWRGDDSTLRGATVNLVKDPQFKEPCFEHVGKNSEKFLIVYPTPQQVEQHRMIDVIEISLNVHFNNPFDPGP